MGPTHDMGSTSGAEETRGEVPGSVQITALHSGPLAVGDLAVDVVFGPVTVIGWDPGRVLAATLANIGEYRTNRRKSKGWRRHVRRMKARA